MILDFSNKTRWLLITLGILFIGIPAVIIAYKIIFSGEDSVVIYLNIDSVVDLFLAGAYGLVVTLLLVGGGVWLIGQIRSLINLKNEKLKVELLHLQSQINPHFFFNMLNNLYGLVDQDTRKAKNMIINLSDMMRYSIYEGQKELVSIMEEIEYLRKFIQLNQSRYHKKIEIRFETEIDNDQQQVTPLLFIILLENAFKHGVEHLRKDPYVNIMLKSKPDQIVFQIENNFDPDEQSAQIGMGLRNLQRRLELLYPGKHDLDIHRTQSNYKATLTLRVQ